MSAVEETGFGATTTVIGAPGVFNRRRGRSMRPRRLPSRATVGRLRVFSPRAMDTSPPFFCHASPLASLLHWKTLARAHAIIGDADPTEVEETTADAMPIPISAPDIHAGKLTIDD